MAKGRNRKINEKMDILKFLEMEGFGSGYSAISRGDYFATRLKTSICSGYGRYDGKYHYRTIGEFRKLMESRGYISGRGLHNKPRDFGMKTLNYFNELLRKHDIKPIAPRRTVPRKKKHSKWFLSKHNLIYALI
jgi:hypothetical protein